MNAEVLRMIDVGSQIVVGVSSPLILLGIHKVWSLIKKERLVNKKLEGGLRSMLRSQIVQMYEFGKSNKGMTLMQKSTAEELYMDYKNLGGNGFIEEVMEKIHKMDEIQEV